MSQQGNKHDIHVPTILEAKQQIIIIIIIIMSICTAPLLTGALSTLQSSSTATKIHFYKSNTHTHTHTHTHSSYLVVKLKQIRFSGGFERKRKSRF